MHFESSTAPAYLNVNGSVNVQANRMFQSGVVQCTLSVCTHTAGVLLLIALEGASAHFIN